MMTRKILLPFLIVLTTLGPASAQTAILITGIGDEEICLGNSLDTVVDIFNADNVSHTLGYTIIIRNVVTGITVYGDSVQQEATIAPLVHLRVPIHYVTSPNKLSQLGTFRVVTSIVQLDANHAEVPGTQDSAVSRLFGIRRINQPFRDYSNNYSKTHWTKLPDQTLWLARGTTVVDGENETWDPPPPQDFTQGGYGPDSLTAPVMKFDRRNEYGERFSGVGGDTLTSFPINFLGQTRFNLMFDFMRGGKRQYPLLWDADTLDGPEQTVLSPNGAVARTGDSLILEFTDTLADQCSPAPNAWHRIAAIDGGRDLEFKRFWMQVRTFDSTITFRITGDTVFTTIPFYNYIDSTFRFRLRLSARDNSAASLHDDGDAWYVDNVTVIIPRRSEAEIAWTHVVTPYAKQSRASAAALPVYVKINCNAVYLVNYPILAIIQNAAGDTVYSCPDTVNSYPDGLDTIHRMSRDWDAHSLAPGKYIVTAKVGQGGFQAESLIQETRSTFYVNLSDDNLQELAYDDGVNDIPEITQQKGAGIGFSSTTGSYAMKITLGKRDTLYGVRPYFASSNQAGDPIRFVVMHDDPVRHIPDTAAPIIAMFQDKRKGDFFNEFWSYYLPTPVALDSGSYWIIVSQLSTLNMCLGGDFSRGGGRIAVASPLDPVMRSIYDDPYGTQYSATENNGDIHTAFAVETPAGAGNWRMWMPDSGFWPTNTMGGMNQMWATAPNFSSFTGAGTYLPMIRAIMAPPSGGTSAVHNVSATILSLDAFPNPVQAASMIAINYSTASDALATLTVIDPLGRVVTTLVDRALNAGEHFAQWQPQVAGSYVVRLATSAGSSVTRMISVQ